MIKTCTACERELEIKEFSINRNWCDNCVRANEEARLIAVLHDLANPSLPRRIKIKQNIY